MCSFLFWIYPCILFPSGSWEHTVAHSTEKSWIRILAVLQDRWLAVGLTPRAILHQSPKTVCFHLCINVRSFRARLLKRLWGNLVSQFWHFISIKHKKCKKWYISAHWPEWICFQSVSDVGKIILVRHGMFFSGHVVIFQLGESTLNITHTIPISYF